MERAPPPAEGEGRVRIGVIGAGWWGTLAHIPAVQKHPHAILTAVQCRTEALALRMAADFGAAHGFSSWRDLLAVEGLDAVIISSTPNVHYDQAKAALERGLHVLIEKPMSIHVAESRELCELARSKGLILLISCPWHYTRHGIEARRLIREGALGDVQMVSILMTHMVRDLLTGAVTYVKYGAEPYVEPERGSYSDPTVAGGGQIYCQVPHMAAYVTFLTGLRPTQVFAQFGPAGGGPDIHNALTVTLENGVLLSLASSGGTPPTQLNNEVRVFGTKGVLQLELWKGDMCLAPFEGDRTEFPPLEKEEIYPMYSPTTNFIEAVLGVAPNGSEGELGLAAMEMIEAACESARTGRPVKIR